MMVWAEGASAPFSSIIQAHRETIPSAPRDLPSFLATLSLIASNFMIDSSFHQERQMGHRGIHRETPDGHVKASTGIWEFPFS